MAAAYAIYHGPKGLKHIAERTCSFANSFASEAKKKYAIVSDHFFDTVCVITGNDTNNILQSANAHKINLRKVSDDKFPYHLMKRQKLLILINCLKFWIKCANKRYWVCCNHKYSL